MRNFYINGVGMNYALTAVKELDRQRILKDFRDDKHTLLTEKYFTNNPDLNWAIDCESDSYIVLAPMEREHGGNWHYYFYFNKSKYQFHVDGIFGEELIFDKHLHVDEIVISAAKEAFITYGRTGSGDM